MTQPTSACPNRMQVHSIRQETPDVWTLSLINHDFYPYRPGQYALVCITNDPDTLRAYTLSSTPGLSPFITLTVRRVEQGTGSGWLTQQVKPGDYLWLSDAQGEFTCVDAGHAEQECYLMMAAGCGVTPIMSMSRWLLAHRPNVHLQVIFNVRNPQQVIFATEWERLTEHYPSQLTLTLVAEFDAETGFLAGRLTPELLKQAVPDLAQRIVMTCGPAPYMQQVAALVADAGVPATRFYKEQFQIGAESLEEDGEQLTLTIRQPLNTLRVPVGISLLAALESHKIPVNAACRAGVCGSCKTKVLSGDYTTSSTMTLTAEEIAQGYVLACSWQLHGDTVLA
ncbi:NADH oxidoreductase [Candidatus Symbiopectobacterium sp. PLON1]|uniref:NADH oxidoreductase n=1 Tax=Candidatus Symbiopectobacterium sp. PLON1 TaxID=2794575 RepID=UPI001A33484B|nr:NADH oxidoreductase [Candidatus Symbiopectobacterium sp. PLON1]MBG6247770.1 NADH oxidoreductase [Candidatus Symbiopectobacterium sp. PLON1]